MLIALCCYDERLNECFHEMWHYPYTNSNYHTFECRVDRMFYQLEDNQKIVID